MVKEIKADLDEYLVTKTQAQMAQAFIEAKKLKSAKEE